MKTQVDFPALRYEVLGAVATLSDSEYQTQTWLDPEPSANSGNHQSFGDIVHTLFDDCEIFPHPERQVGTILLPGDEVVRLAHLGSALNTVIDEFGVDRAADMLRNAAWTDVVIHAGAALAAMNRAGGWLWPGAQ